MPERKVLQRHHVFVKKEFTDNKQWIVDLGLGFQPDEMHVRNVAFSHQEVIALKSETKVETAILRGKPNWMATLYMENVGDLCTLTEAVNRSVNYIFDVKSALSFARFELRNINGELTDMAAAPATVYKTPDNTNAKLVLHLEFIKYEEHKH